MKGMIVCTFLLLSIGCGPGIEDVSNPFVGTLALTEKEDELTYMREVSTYHVFVSPGVDDELIIRLTDGCAVGATLDGDDISLIEHQCTEEIGGATKDVKVTGSGTFTDDGQTLSLTWVAKGSAIRGDQTLTYEGKHTFKGKVP